jgi:beta-glucosidase
MTASFDVEDVLSKLNLVEKVSLLAGQFIQHPSPL